MTGWSRCVVDASVGVKLLMGEELSETAEALVDEIAARPNAVLYVPDLFYAECANALWKYVLRYDYSQADARRNLDRVFSLGLSRIPTPTLVPAAWAIAVAHSISVYDACYVAAADLVGAPLVTADQRLVNRLANTHYQVRYLGALGV